jgi:carbohydrate-selective porin OprB
MLPTADRGTGTDALYVPEQKREYRYKINYGYPATRGLMARPNLHYVKSPRGAARSASAVAGGGQFIADC